MRGQFSNEEFISIYSKCNNLKGFDPVKKTAWMKYGEATYNYYHQHDDGSWTNYDCKTHYYPM